MKIKSTFIGLLLLGTSSLSFAQEIGISTGLQVVRGEVSEYSNQFNSITAISTYWGLKGNPSIAYGAELRYAGMNQSPSLEDSWLNGYSATGSDFSLMGQFRYYFLSVSTVKNRKGSFTSWAQAGVGFHVMNYRTTIPSVKALTNTKTGELSDRMSSSAGAIEFGMGVQYYLAQNWSINFYGGGQYTGNDYMDGVAGIGDHKDFPFFGMIGCAYHLL